MYFFRKECFFIAYVEVPKDLSKVKTKVLFNLTKRQLICFSLAALTGVPTYFIFKSVIGVSAASLIMILLMLPFFLLAVYEKNGQPLEVLLKQYIRVRFLRPKRRPYRTQNYYAILEHQMELRQEVKKIVQSGKNKTETDKETAVSN